MHAHHAFQIMVAASDPLGVSLPAADSQRYLAAIIRPDVPHAYDPRSGFHVVLLPACFGLVSVGLGIGLTWPHLVTQIFQRAPASEQDLAAAAITTVQLAAAALGAAAAGMVANLAGIANPGGIAGASNAAAWLFGVFALAPVLCCLAARRAVQE